MVLSEDKTKPEGFDQAIKAYKQNFNVFQSHHNQYPSQQKYQNP